MSFISINSFLNSGSVAILTSYNEDLSEGHSKLGLENLAVILLSGDIQRLYFG